MSIITSGNIPSLLKEGLYLPKKKKKKTSATGENQYKKTNTKNKGN